MIDFIILNFTISLSFYLMLQGSHTLVQVFAFLHKVEVHLVAHENLVAAVAGVYGRRVHLVGISHNNAVYITADEHRN